MSAIWGHISAQTIIEENLHTIMQTPYLRKCKIDRYQNILTPYVYMECGLQLITSESPNECLPIYDKTHEIYFTADCIIDNRSELISTLKCSQDIPDGSLMYQAYLKWGIHCLEHLRGLFSMAVYDAKKKTLYLATDQTASRCLYYYTSDQGTTFSTLITPIRTLYRGIALNTNYLKDFLTAPGLMPNIVSDETPYSGIKKINPGCYIEISDGTAKEYCYWSPSLPMVERNARTADDYGRLFHSIYKECVSDALRTNGNVGISLSSGLDSASVGALAAQTLKTQNKQLYSYTYVPYETLEEDKNKNNVHNEMEDVMKIVSMYPNILPRFLNNNGKNCIEYISHELNVLEIPFKAYGNLPSLCEVYEKAHEENCKILLTGQAGNSTISHGYVTDILYDLYKNKNYLKLAYATYKFCRHCHLNFQKFSKYLYKSFKNADTIPQHYSIPSSFSNPFINIAECTNYPLEERYNNGVHAQQERGFITHKRYQHSLCCKAQFSYLGESETKFGLYYGIVLRDPTRDMRILQFCYHIPYEFFAYKGTPRWLIRGAMCHELPRELTNNWTRYGVQNSDWLLRIKRDWHLIVPYFEKIIFKYNNLIYIDNSIFQPFFTTISKELTHDYDKDFLYFVIIIIFYEFLNISDQS